MKMIMLLWLMILLSMMIMTKVTSAKEPFDDANEKCDEMIMMMLLKMLLMMMIMMKVTSAKEPFCSKELSKPSPRQLCQHIPVEEHS